MGEHADEAWMREAFAMGGVKERNVTIISEPFMPEIQNNVPIPDAKKKVTKRARAAAGKKTNEPKANPAAGLIQQLQFIAMAQKPAGTAYQTHCMINSRWAVAFDGVLTVGTPIQEDIQACPNTTQLLAALQRCGEQVQISQVSDGVIVVKSERFRASIDCIPFNELPPSWPDVAQGPVTDALKTGFAAVNWLINETATEAWKQAILLQNLTMVASEGHALVEFMHGIQLPISILLPKAAINAVMKHDKPLVAMGVSDNSATFHYADNSFIKTQLFKDNYPNYLPVFEGFNGETTPIPDDFFTGIDSVAPFCKDSKALYIRGDKLQSHKEEERGAVYQMSAALHENIIFNYEFLKAVKPYFSNVVFDKERGKVFFRTNNLRGAIMRMTP